MKSLVTKILLFLTTLSLPLLVSAADTLFKGGRWLVTDRTIKGVGLDTASIDYGQSKLFESHRILFEKNIPAFENVSALDQLPPSGTYVIALPMKIKGGSGAPLRIVAWVPEKQ